jgi:hypothetical protein
MLANPDYLYMICPKLEGYALSTNRWGYFNIEQISQVTPTSEAYDYLVMPPRKKDFGEEESVSEKLSELLRRADDWKAILLFDEADVFLRKRGTDERRDGIVSAFLWQLERHKGVVFLITNLFHDLDIAVESRAHIHIQFPPLDRASRRLIWSRFVTRILETGEKIGKYDLDELSKWRLSGRQIKNVLIMARARCFESSTPLSLAAIEETIDLTCSATSKEKDDEAGDGHVLVNGSSPSTGKVDLLDLS